MAIFQYLACCFRHGVEHSRKRFRFRLGSGAGTEPVERRIWEFIWLEITCDILEWIPVIFCSVEEGNLEILDGHLSVFQDKIVAGKSGDHLDPRACGSVESFGKEDPIASSCHMGSEEGYEPCFQGDRSQDWIATEVSRALCE